MPGPDTSGLNRKYRDESDFYMVGGNFKGIKSGRGFPPDGKGRVFVVKVYQHRQEILRVLENTDWSALAFRTTHGAFHLRVGQIKKAITDAGFVDRGLF